MGDEFAAKVAEIINLPIICTVGAVSYTHLDVYKRQGLPNGIFDRASVVFAPYNYLHQDGKKPFHNRLMQQQKMTC